MNKLIKYIRIFFSHKTEITLKKYILKKNYEFERLEIFKTLLWKFETEFIQKTEIFPLHNTLMTLV